MFHFCSTCKKNPTESGLDQYTAARGGAPRPRNAPPALNKIYPDRILPVDEKAAAILRKRTLTNLYNERLAWLDHAHRDLDAAIAAAYGWPADLTDDAILERLFKLNQARAAA